MRKLLYIALTGISMLMLGCEQNLEEEPSRTTVSGAVVDGPVSGSQVFVSTCFQAETAIISSTSSTNESGLFEIQMNDDVIDGLYCAVAVGGEYLNTATGEIEVLEAGTQMYTPFLYEEGVNVEVAITPFTSLIYEMTAADVSRGLDLVNSYNQSRAFVSESFSGLDPIHTIPTTSSIYRPTQPTSDTESDESNYTAILTALENYADRLGMAGQNETGSTNDSTMVTPLDVIRILSSDYEDGAFNGYTTVNDEALPIQLAGAWISGSSVWLGLAQELLAQAGDGEVNSHLSEFANNLLTYSPGVFVGQSAGSEIDELISEYDNSGIDIAPSIISGDTNIVVDSELLLASETIDVLLDGQLVGTFGSGDTGVVLDTHEFSDGVHELTYSVQYIDGTTRDYSENLSINNSDPYVTIDTSHFGSADSFVIDLTTNGINVASLTLDGTPLTVEDDGSVVIPPISFPEGENQVVLEIQDLLGNEYLYPVTLFVDAQEPLLSYSYSEGLFLLGDGGTRSEYLDNAYLLNEPLIVGGAAVNLDELIPSANLLDSINVPYVLVERAEVNLQVEVETTVDQTSYLNTFRLPRSSGLDLAIPVDYQILGSDWINYYDSGRTNLRVSVFDAAGNETSAMVNFNSVINDEVVEISSDVIGGEVNVYDYIDGAYSLVGSCTTNEFGLCRVIATDQSSDSLAPENENGFMYVEIVSGTHQDQYSGELTEIISSGSSANAGENGPLRALIPESFGVTPALSPPGSTASPVIVDSASTIFTALALAGDDHSGSLAQNGIGSAPANSPVTTTGQELAGTEAAVAQAQREFEELFGFDPLTGEVVDLSDEDITSVSDGVERALINGALSQLATTLDQDDTSVNVLSITDLIAEDLADRELDGVLPNGIQAALPSGESLQEAVYQGQLIESLIEFSNSTNNTTSIRDQDLFDYAQTVSGSISNASNPGGADTVTELDPFDYGSSLVTFDLAPNESISGTSVLYANVSDVLELDGLTAEIDGQSLPVAFEDGAIGINLTDVVGDLPSGSYEITIDLDVAGTDENLRVVQTISVDNDNPEYIAEFSSASFLRGNNIVTESLENLGSIQDALIFSTVTGLRGIEKTVAAINSNRIPYISLFVSDNTEVASVEYVFNIAGQEYSGGLLRDADRYVLPLDLNYLVSDGFLVGTESESHLQIVISDQAGNRSDLEWQFSSLSHGVIGTYETVDVGLGHIGFQERNQLDNRRRTTTKYSFTNNAASDLYLTLSDNRTHEAYETFDTAIRLNRAYVESAFRLRKRNLLNTDCQPEWSDWVSVNRLYNYDFSGGRVFSGWNAINATSSMSDHPRDVYADDGIFPEWSDINPGQVFNSGDRDYDLVTDTGDRSTASYWACSGENYAQSQNAQIYHSIEGYPRNEVGVEVDIHEFNTVDIVVHDNTAGDEIVETDGVFVIPSGHSVTISKVVAMPNMAFYNNLDVDDLDTFRSYVLHRLDSSLLWQIKRPIDVGLRITPNGRIFQQTLGENYTTYLLRRPGTF